MPKGVAWMFGIRHLSLPVIVVLSLVATGLLAGLLLMIIALVPKVFPG